MDVLVSVAWVVSGLMLFGAAWLRFNMPPTQRSGTTCFLFQLGLLFYFVLLLAIWAFEVLLLKSGVRYVPQRAALGTLELALPAVSMLLVVLSSLSGTVQRMDAEARKFCSLMAAIPREKDRLAVELKEHAALRLTDANLRRAVVREAQRQGVGEAVLDFSGLTAPAGGYTKVLTLYCAFFVLPREAAGAAAGSPLSLAYRRFMASHQQLVRRVQGKAEALFPHAKDYFALSTPTSSEITDHFLRQIDEVFGLFAELLSRAVLSAEVTRKARHRRLAQFGFWTDPPRATLGLDQYTALVFGVLGYFIAFFVLFPREAPADSRFVDDFFKALMIAVEVGVAAVVGVHAAHWNERRDEALTFPPLASFTVAAVLAMGLCALLRLGVYVLPKLPLEGLAAVGSAVNAFQERWPWRFMAFFLTFGVGVACRFASRSSLPVARIMLITSIIVAVFCLAGGSLVLAFFGSLAPQDHDDWVRVFRVWSGTALLGLAIGASVPMLYRVIRKQEAETRGAVRGEQRRAIAVDGLCVRRSPAGASVA